jgi:hypothetical protein
MTKEEIIILPNNTDLESLFEKARQSIKHPHFYYAVVDTETKTISFERKKWYKWLSGKRIVAVKIIKLQMPSLYGEGQLYYTKPPKN